MGDSLPFQRFYSRQMSRKIGAGRPAFMIFVDDELGGKTPSSETPEIGTIAG